MSKNAFLFWPIVILFFMLWTMRVLYLSAPEVSDGVTFLLGTSLRVLIFLIPFILTSLYIFKESVMDAFALHKATLVGWGLAALYSVGVLSLELSQRAFIIPTNPWILINFPFAPIIEELAFRGFIFTHLLEHVGKWQTVCITSVLSVFIHFPGWIFLAGLQGEQFLTVTGSVLIFSLFQGVIRLYSKSVYPNILVHLLNNLLVIMR